MFLISFLTCMALCWRVAEVHKSREIDTCILPLQEQKEFVESFSQGSHSKALFSYPRRDGAVNTIFHGNTASKTPNFEPYWICVILDWPNVHVIFLFNSNIVYLDFILWIWTV